MEIIPPSAPTVESLLAQAVADVLRKAYANGLVQPATDLGPIIDADPVPPQIEG